MKTRGCPHDKITDCPLYRAMHVPELVGFGCDDGRLAEGGCAVNRELDYDAQVERLWQHLKSLKDSSSFFLELKLDADSDGDQP